MSKENHIDYFDIPCSELELSKQFFSQVFQWKFKDFGSEYAAFENAGVSGGFFEGKSGFKLSQGVPLMVIYRENLDKATEEIVAAGGAITHPVFAFPGGSRFHFTDPSGNEFACWSDS